MKNILFILSMISIFSAESYADGNWQTQSLSGENTAAYYSSISSGKYQKEQYLIAAYLDNAAYINGNPWGEPTFGQYIGGKFYKISVSTATKSVTELVPYIDEKGIYYFTYIDSNGDLQYGKIRPGFFQDSIVTEKVGSVSFAKNRFKDAGSIFPNWYGINNFSYAVYNDDIYINYNVDNNGTTQIKSKKCHGEICYILPSLLNQSNDFAYFSSTSVHNGKVYVSFNERVGGNNGSIYGVVKVYNPQLNTWDKVCGGNLSIPGTVSKVISRVEFNKRGNPVVLDTTLGSDGALELNVMECKDNIWTKLGNKYVQNQAVWYPQLVVNPSTKNDINVIYRSEYKQSHAQIFAKSYSYSSGKWIGLGGVNGDGLVSDPNVLTADQQISSLQNGALYVEYKQSTELGSIEILRPVVKKYDTVRNKWDYVCNSPVHTNSKNTNVWYAAGSGGFINNFAGQNFIIYEQNFENNPNQPDISDKPGKYSVNLGTCTAN